MKNKTQTVEDIMYKHFPDERSLCCCGQEYCTWSEEQKMGRLKKMVAEINSQIQQSNEKYLDEFVDYLQTQEEPYFYKYDVGAYKQEFIKKEQREHE